MKIKFIFFLIITVQSLIEGQHSLWSIHLIQSPGILLKHSDKMKFNPSGVSQFSELQLSYHTQGKNIWERVYGLPRWGLGLRYLNIGQPSEVLGQGFSFYPFMDFGFIKRKSSSLRLIIGCGLAYLDKKYHIKYNSNQTAIGSHWNNLSTFQFKYEFSILKSHSISMGISLSHISNGAFKSPNLGLNFASAVFEYSFHFDNKHIRSSWRNSSDSSLINIDKRTLSRFSSGFEYGLSLKEGQTPGGPKFLIQWYLLDLGYQYNDFKSWRLAIELENNHIGSFYNSYSEVKESKKDAADQNWRINAYLSHQWMLGNISLCFRSGYQFKRIEGEDLIPLITKLDLCYVLPIRQMQTLKPYLGFSLKAHLDTASYIGLMAGLRFHKTTRSHTFSSFL